jgi:polar amino acid transport system permease protein
MGAGEFLFLLKGLQWTFALSAIAFATGTLTGLAVALLRSSGFPAAERATSSYIALFQGTPLLMQLFVVYYGLALVGLNLDAWVAVAIGFTLHASAYLGEIWRGSIDAVPSGQTEAASALGLGYVARWATIPRGDSLTQAANRKASMPTSPSCSARSLAFRSNFFRWRSPTVSQP